MTEGTVKFFNDVKGYGFIRPDDSQKDIFFHITQVAGKQIEKGERVTFYITEGLRGPTATGVIPI